MVEFKLASHPRVARESLCIITHMGYYSSQICRFDVLLCGAHVQNIQLWSALLHGNPFGSPEAVYSQRIMIMIMALDSGTLEFSMEPGRTGTTAAHACG